MEVLTELDGERVRSLLGSETFFWLDVADPGDDELRELQSLLGWHPLVVEDAAKFGQRPKLDDYGDYAQLVFYGASGGRLGRSPASGADAAGPGGQTKLPEARRRETATPELDLESETGPAVQLIEVHLLVSGSYVVTLHPDPCTELDDLRDRFARRGGGPEQFVVYSIVDALTDTFFPVLSHLDDEIDDLEDAVITGPTDEQLHRLFRLKRTLVAMRKIVSPQRDMFARAGEDLMRIPGLEPAARDYFRDVYDHLIRISDLIDSYRDLLSGAMDVYLSTVSNRLNVVMKQLTVIATVFLPLTFVTGFFGQNFEWLTERVDTLWAFLVFGIGGLLVSVVALFSWFRRSGYL